jgi:hypothetical protein
MNVKGLVNLKTENTLEPLIQERYVIDSLPKNIDVILGQDWLVSKFVIRYYFLFETCCLISVGRPLWREV